MKKPCVFVSIFIFLAIAADAQIWKTTKDFEASFEADYDAVWSATVKALMSLKYRIVSSDKNSGTISATKRRTIFDDTGDEKASWDLFIEEEDGKVLIYAQHQLGSEELNIGGPAKRRFRNLAEKIAEHLSKK